MPAGMECYNPDGTLQWSSLSSRLMTILLSVQTGITDGSVVVPGLANREGIVLRASPAVGYYPVVTISGTTVSWTFDAAWPSTYRQNTLLTVLGY